MVLMLFSILEFEEADYQVSLSDGAVRGQFVAKVRAVDLDEGGLLVYSIIGGNKHEVSFMLNILFYIGFELLMLMLLL